MLIDRDKRTKILRKPLSSRGREKAMRRRRKKLRIRNCEHKAGNMRTPRLVLNGRGNNKRDPHHALGSQTRQKRDKGRRKESLLKKETYSL